MELRPPHFSRLTLWKSMEFPDFHVEKRLPPSSAMALSPMFTRKCLNIFSYVWQPQFFSVGVTVMATAITGWDSKSFKPSRSWGGTGPPPPRKEALAEGVTHIARQGVAQKIHPHLGAMASMAMWFKPPTENSSLHRITSTRAPFQGVYFMKMTLLRTQNLSHQHFRWCLSLKTGTFWGRSANI